MTQTIDQVIDHLIAGHDGGPLMADFPDHLVPQDLAEVYALQDRIIGRLGSIGGWKVMAGGEGDPLCAPIPSTRYFDNGATLRNTHHNLVLTEIEVAVRLGSDLPSGASGKTVESAIAALLPAIEMVGSPFVDRNAIPFNAKLADLQSNGAVVTGADFAPGIRTNLSSLPVSLELDGTVVKEAETGASFDAIVQAVQWLASHAATRGLPLRAGHVIITGSRVLHAHGNAKTVTGDFGPWGQVGLRLEP